ncbi:MAG: hypothetical protein A2096_06405 [Spirochaetes bacterium GWF1_41_5]|nr:MAG: hypothetical protein A2096_06405 [Spirochaetes bacterium GWF1_41_5]
MLFPFHDRIPGGKYCFGGREYRLPVNDPETGSAIHGLVYNQEFSIADMQTHCFCAELVLEYYLEASAGYPFKMHLKIKYRLTKNRLIVFWKIKNTGTGTAPFTLGWHPYFKADEKIDNAELLCPSKYYAETDQKALPTGKIISTRNTGYDFSAPVKIAGRELDLPFTAPGSDIRLFLKDRFIRIRQKRNFFRWVQIFIPPDRESIALEPVSSPPNVFNLPALGLYILQPGKTIKAWAEVCIKKLSIFSK